MAKKIGIIRCEINSIQCNGLHCFEVLEDGSQAFSVHDDDLLLVGYATCGGCCGRDALRRVKKMVADGDEAMHLGNCVWSEKCPFKERILSAVEGLRIPIIKGTHKTFD